MIVCSLHCCKYCCNYNTKCWSRLWKNFDPKTLTTLCAFQAGPSLLTRDFLKLKTSYQFRGFAQLVRWFLCTRTRCLGNWVRFYFINTQNIPVNHICGKEIKICTLIMQTPLKLLSASLEASILHAARIMGLYSARGKSLSPFAYCIIHSLAYPIPFHAKANVKFPFLFEFKTWMKASLCVFYWLL